MRTFKEGNWSHNAKCPICKKASKGEVVLIGVEGTENNGNMKAEQFHLECIELLYDKKVGFI